MGTSQNQNAIPTNYCSSSRRRILAEGTAASGRIDRGVVRANDEIEIVGIKEKNPKKAVVTGVGNVP